MISEAAVEAEVTHAVARRAELIACQPRPFQQAIGDAVQVRLRRSSPGNSTAVIAPAVLNALLQRATHSQPVPRPFDQVVPRPSPSSAPSGPAPGGATAAGGLATNAGSVGPATTLSPASPVPVPNAPSPAAAPSASGAPTTGATQFSPTPTSPTSTPTIPSAAARGASSHPTVATPPASPATGAVDSGPVDTATTIRQAGRGGRRVGRLGRAVRVGMVGGLVGVASVAGWFFWGDIKCAIAQGPEAAADACLPPADSLRIAANDLLDAVNAGDVSRIRSHLPGRCSQSDRELLDSAAEAAARRPQITSVAAAGRGGTVDVLSEGQSYTTVWLLTGGRWQLQICDALDRLSR